eukprot:14244666-Alexandrium_andersonii.AAC.1
MGDGSGSEDASAVECGLERRATKAGRPRQKRRHGSEASTRWRTSAGQMTQMLRASTSAPRQGGTRPGWLAMTVLMTWSRSHATLKVVWSSQTTRKDDGARCSRAGGTHRGRGSGPSSRRPAGNGGRRRRYR